MLPPSVARGSLSQADKQLYPALKHVTVVGHSAGGQTVQRYALVAGAGDSGAGRASRATMPSSTA